MPPLTDATGELVTSKFVDCRRLAADELWRLG
jgi:hypothetical protein